MEPSRLPRFARASPVAALQITGRDREIIQLVHQHRFLRSSHIISLVSGSSQQVLRRLKLLYHHGYLERPRAQLEYFHRGGSRPIVYGLGNKGVALLKKEFGVDFKVSRCSEKSRAIGRMFLEHGLLVSDVMVTLELACRRSGKVRLIPEDVLASDAMGSEQDSRFQWKVNLAGGIRLGLVPDRVFALEFPAQSSRPERVYFFLEADRGTMPVIRKGLVQTSIHRKLLAYEATWAQSIHRKRFGFHRFRVLTVTTGAARLKSIVEACSQLKGGHGLFLFADRNALESLTDISSPIWQTYNGETTGLL
jgi:hypothetical protein